MAIAQDGKPHRHVVNIADGLAAVTQDVSDLVVQVGPAKERGVPAGLAVSTDRKTLYVANVWGHYVTAVDLSRKTNLWELPLSLVLSNRTEARLQPSQNMDEAAARRIAEGAPHPLELPGVRIEHDDALVAIAIGDVELAGRRVHEHVGDDHENPGLGNEPTDWPYARRREGVGGNVEQPGDDEHPGADRRP